MIARTLVMAASAWTLGGLPALAAEPADAELLSFRARTSLFLGDSSAVRRFTEPFSTTLEAAGQGRVTVQSSAIAGGGIDAQAESRAGRVMADFDATQTFTFADASSPLQVTFAHAVVADVFTSSGSGGGQVGYGLSLFAPNGRTLLRRVWTERSDGASASWFTDLGPVTFLAESGTYRLEVDGIAIADAPGAGGVARAGFSSFLTFNVTPVPEPAQWALLIGGLGLLGLAAGRRRRCGRSALQPIPRLGL